MAGRPRRQAMIAELLKRTADEFDDQPDATPLDYVELRLASGDTLKDLGDSIAKATKPADIPDELSAIGWVVSGEMIRRYLEQSWGAAETEQRLQRARARGSYSGVDEAKSIADAASEDAGAVALARLRVSTRHWMAERFNPNVFGQAKGPTVSISVGSLHLAALQSTTLRVTGGPETPTLALPAASQE